MTHQEPRRGGVVVIVDDINVFATRNISAGSPITNCDPNWG